MINNQKLSNLFWLIRGKTRNDNFIPIYARTIIDGDRDEFSTGKMVQSDNWEARRTAKDDPDYKVINSKLLQIQASLDRHFMVLQTQHERVTPLMLKNVFNNLPANYKKEKIRRLNTPV